ncbi:hypothetical protein NP233_g6198 [Leucocoprinus birnbaumii]|uniref:Uncharacterized protein n=1 Tax=Leucocoprinus birnbaumii TaxID=56174 RepID=A0AAD5VRG2_9AGAR|nr:hypothetical protein NP233_g6198 [Leucocoprinus birnbaumii]
MKVKEEGRSKGKGKERAHSPGIEQDHKDSKQKLVPGNKGTPTPMSKHPWLSDNLTQTKMSSESSTLVKVAPATSSSSSPSATPGFSISNPFECSPSPPLPISKMKCATNALSLLITSPLTSTSTTLDMTVLANIGFASMETSVGIKESSHTIPKNLTSSHIAPSHPVQTQTMALTPLAPLATTQMSPASLEIALLGRSTSGNDKPTHSVNAARSANPSEDIDNIKHITYSGSPRDVSSPPPSHSPQYIASPQSSHCPKPGSVTFSQLNTQEQLSTPEQL